MVYFPVVKVCSRMPLPLMRMLRALALMCSVYLGMPGASDGGFPNVLQSQDSLPNRHLGGQQLAVRLALRNQPAERIV